MLDAQEKGAGGEIQLTDAMAKLIGKQPFHALTFDAVRHDCGDKAGFVIANLALALGATRHRRRRCGSIWRACEPDYGSSSTSQ